MWGGAIENRDTEIIKWWQQATARFGLIGFYRISNLIGYLEPNPVYTYIICIHILLIIFLNKPELIFFVFGTQLNDFIVKEVQVLLFSTNNSIPNYSFVSTLMSGSKYSYVSLTI